MITNYITENKRCNTTPSVVYTSVPPGDASMFINVFITEDNFGFGGTFGRTLFFGIVFECTFTRSPCDVLQSCLQFDNSARLFFATQKPLPQSLTNETDFSKVIPTIETFFREEDPPRRLTKMKW